MKHDLVHAHEPTTGSSPATRLSRRQVLAAGGAGLAFLSVAGARVGKAAPKTKARVIPIGLQLWSVREDCAKDFDGTLGRVAAMGFAGVEFAGYHAFANDAPGLRKLLDKHHLRAEGAHVHGEQLTPDKIKATIEFHKVLGCKFLIVAGEKRFTDPNKSKDYAEEMNKLAATLKPEGLFCGHHNHTGEFALTPAGDKTYWDLFAERTTKDVILQQDVGWTTVAGLDPVALVKRYPGRTRSAHFKAKLPKGAPADKKPIIGQDTIDWKSLITACTDVGGTEWFIVEQEDYPDGLSPLDACKASLTGLKTILASMGR